MPLRLGSTNRFIRLTAAIVLTCFSAALIPVAPPLALLGAAVGVVAAWHQAVRMWRERRDRYDLSRLWEATDEPEEPEPDGKIRNLAFCHRCGASMPTHHSICPECGVPLGN